METFEIYTGVDKLSQRVNHINPKHNRTKFYNLKQCPLNWFGLLALTIVSRSLIQHKMQVTLHNFTYLLKYITHTYLFCHKEKQISRQQWLYGFYRSVSYYHQNVCGENQNRSIIWSWSFYDINLKKMKRFIHSFFPLSNICVYCEVARW